VFLTPPETPPNARVEQDEVVLHQPHKDSAALKIVIQDTERTEKWLQHKQNVLRWDQCQILYEAPQKIEYWDGTDIPKSHLSVFTVAKVAQSILPQITNALFADDPEFMLQPRPGTTQDTARAVTALLDYQLDDCDFRNVIEEGILSCEVFGTHIWKWGWESVKRTRKVYVRNSKPINVPSGIPGGPPITLDTEDSDDIEVQEIEETIQRPILESLRLREVFVDSSLAKTDIRKAKFVCHRMKLSAAQLDDLRDFEGYDILPKAELISLCFPPEEQAPTSALETRASSGYSDFQATPRDQETTSDPTEELKFELLEYWTKERVITVLNRKLVIRNEQNPYGVIPFVAMQWWAVPNSFYGLGLGHTIGGEQLIQAGTINARMNQMSLNLNRGFIRVKGKNVPTGNIRLAPGRIIDVDDQNSLKPMEKIDAVGEAFEEVQASDARAEATSGANELLVGGNMPDKGRTSLTSTATGANLLAGGTGSRMQAFVERFAMQVFRPVLEAFMEMDRMLLPMSMLRRILNDELQLAYQGDHLDILNARVSFNILAAARLQERRQMAQSLPFISQVLLTDPVHSMLQAAGQKIDIREIVSMYFDVSGWRNKRDVVKDMTPEDEQRVAMQNPAVQQALLAQQKAKLDQDTKLRVIDAENTGQAYREIQRQVIEKALTDEALNGQPGNTGFGSQG
jgi:hypothetical protein